MSETAIAHVRQGRAFEDAGRDLDALREFLAAENLAPGFEAASKIGALFLKLGKAADAVRWYRRALEYKPRSAPTLLALCRAHADLFDDESGLEALSRAAKIDPAAAEVPLTRAHLFQMRGRFNDAEAELERSLELDPNLGVAYHGLVGTRRLTEADRPLVDRIRRALAVPNLAPINASNLNFSLGKALDDLGEYEEAMRAYDDANRIVFETRIGARATNPGLLANSMAARIAMFDRAFFADRPSGRPCGAPSECPVFVVGMIRSGTTLLEQLLSSHPEVAAAGELSFWVHAEARLVNYGRRTLDEPGLAAGAQDYLALIQEFASLKDSAHVARVTDKYPANFLALGLIHTALPNAKIVHVRRNPVDTALSIYTTPLRTPPNYGCDKENIAAFYEQYLRLMAHWRAVLPASRFIEVRYEDLVAQPEAEMRRLLDFCGLPWSEDCRHPERNPRPVRTPSFWQVRQPLYRSSVGRWERFRPWLGAFARLIDADGGS